tara:strand:- start:763 stop:972 length:210 start_codon:yes stop_codon:yes gene_type:complete
MPKRKKVEKLPDFEKDTVTQAIINNNSTDFANRKEQQAMTMAKDAEFQQMKDDIAEIKKLLKGLSKSKK